MKNHKKNIFDYAGKIVIGLLFAAFVSQPYVYFFNLYFAKFFPWGFLAAGLPIFLIESAEGRKIESYLRPSDFRTKHLGHYLNGLNSFFGKILFLPGIRDTFVFKIIYYVHFTVFIFTIHYILYYGALIV